MLSGTVILVEMIVPVKSRSPTMRTASGLCWIASHSALLNTHEGVRGTNLLHLEGKCQQGDVNIDIPVVAREEAGVIV